MFGVNISWGVTVFDGVKCFGGTKVLGGQHLYLIWSLAFLKGQYFWVIKFLCVIKNFGVQNFGRLKMFERFKVLRGFLFCGFKVFGGSK